LNELSRSIDEGRADMSATGARQQRNARLAAEAEAESMNIATTAQEMSHTIEAKIRKKGRDIVRHANLHTVPYKQAVRPDTQEERHALAVATGRAASVPLEQEATKRFPRAMAITKAHSRANDLADRQPERATPLTHRRGLPLPEYPWATPTRQGMGYIEPPKSGWRRYADPPWHHPRDAGRILSTDVKGQIQEHWKGRRAPREGGDPPWFEEPTEYMQRSEQVSSIMQHPPASTMVGHRDTMNTLCPPDVTKSNNLRARGGKQWNDYLNPSDPILQRGNDAYARSIPHRDVMNLTKRVNKFDSAQSDASVVRRPNMSREKGARRPARKNNWTTEAATNFIRIDKNRMQKLRGTQTMACPMHQTVELRKHDGLKVRDNHLVLVNQPNLGPSQMDPHFVSGYAKGFPSPEAHREH